MLPFCLCISVGMGTRNGTDVDAASVAKTFKNLGYKVKILNDQTVAEMKRLLLDGKKMLKLTSVFTKISPSCYSQRVS